METAYVTEVSDTGVEVPAEVDETHMNTYSVSLRLKKYNDMMKGA
jgi:hypothetical protein